MTSEGLSLIDIPINLLYSRDHSGIILSSFNSVSIQFADRTCRSGRGRTVSSADVKRYQFGQNLVIRGVCVGPDHYHPLRNRLFADDKVHIEVVVTGFVEDLQAVSIVEISGWSPEISQAIQPTPAS